MVPVYFHAVGTKLKAHFQHISRTLTCLTHLNGYFYNVYLRMWMCTRARAGVSIEQSNRSLNSNNLIRINTSDYNNNDIYFQFLLANVQSIKSKEYILNDKRNKNNVTFAGISETWLRNDDVAWVECSQFNTDGYKIVTANCRNRKCGGLVLIYKEENTAKIIESGQKRSFEYLLCSISLKHDDVTNQNKPAALCIVGFIGGPLSDNTGIFPPF